MIKFWLMVNDKLLFNLLFLGSQDILPLPIGLGFAELFFTAQVAVEGGNGQAGHLHGHGISPYL